MFFKRRVWILPPWWVRMDDVQRKYARRLADALGRRASRVSAGRMRLYTVLVFGGLAGLNIVMAVRSSERHWMRMGQAQVHGMRRVIMPREKANVLGPDLFATLDSLRKDSVGGRMLDSLLRARPGLEDSLKLMEGWK